MFWREVGSKKEAPYSGAKQKSPGMGTETVYAYAEFKKRRGEEDKASCLLMQALAVGLVS